MITAPYSNPLLPASLAGVMVVTGALVWPVLREREHRHMEKIKLTEHADEIGQTEAGVVQMVLTAR